MIADNIKSAQSPIYCGAEEQNGAQMVLSSLNINKEMGLISRLIYLIESS